MHKGSSGCERLLEMARGASVGPEPQRRESVKGIIHERIRLVPIWKSTARRGGETKAIAGFEQPYRECSEADIFQAAYGDREGRAYWQASLFEQRPHAELADLLATHVAGNDDELHRIRKAIVVALQNCDPANTFDRALWLFENPNTRRFIPESLARLLIAAADSAEQREAAGTGGNQRGPKPGQTTAKDRACQIALEILSDEKRRPQFKHGWKTALARQVHQALAAEGFPYGQAWVEKAIRPTINECAKRTRTGIRCASWNTSKRLDIKWVRTGQHFRKYPVRTLIARVVCS
jgi:hypothetical protein